MEALLQPTHLFFILLVILIIFGPGKLPEIGEGSRRGQSDLRGVPSAFRNALFMAKGVDPKIGRDVGDMLPDEHAKRDAMLYRGLLAILLGNTIYFLLAPLLPASARLDTGAVSGLPVAVDLWICVMVWGILMLLRPIS